jgi:hypothetical protein
LALALELLNRRKPADVCRKEAVERVDDGGRSGCWLRQGSAARMRVKIRRDDRTTGSNARETEAQQEGEE